MFDEKVVLLSDVSGKCGSGATVSSAVVVRRRTIILITCAFIYTVVVSTRTRDLEFGLEAGLLTHQLVRVDVWYPS